MRAPLSEAHCGGGVWRLRWQPLPGAESGTTPLLAAACMHGGCRVMRLADTGSELAVVGSFTAHESLAYGIDWLGAPPLRPLGETSISGSSAGLGGASSLGVRLVSCSFYDKAVYAWGL
jgi:diphthine methyl ester acylhydrolase